MRKCRRSRLRTAAARFILLTAAVLFCILLPVRPAMADGEWSWTNSDTEYSAVILDTAELLDEEETEELEAVMEKTTVFANAAFITAYNYEYRTTEFAEELYRRLFDRNSGTLFLVDMGQRELYIFSDGEAYRTITSNKANSITDNVYRMASRGEYGACAVEVFSEINTLLEGGRIAEPMRIIVNVLSAVGLALLINFLIVCAYAKKRKPTEEEWLLAIRVQGAYSNPHAVFKYKTEHYNPPASSSGGGSSGGGGGFSGGGGGGGHSGGGGGHSF